MFVNNSYSEELTFGSYIEKSGVFLKRFKFAQYLEKVLRKKAVRKYEGSKLRWMQIRQNWNEVFYRLARDILSKFI